MLSAEDNHAINRVNTDLQTLQFLEGYTFVSKTALTNTCYGDVCPITVFRVVMAKSLISQADVLTAIKDQLTLAQVVCGDVNAAASVTLAKLEKQTAPWNILVWFD